MSIDRINELVNNAFGLQNAKEAGRNEQQELNNAQPKDKPIQSLLSDRAEFDSFSDIPSQYLQLINNLYNQINNIVLGVNSVHASDDQAALAANNSIILDVIANDNDPNGEAFSVTWITDAPDNGNVSINADGTITYTPNTDFIGNDQFTYQITDEFDNTDEAIVYLTVGADEIIAADDIASTTRNTAVTINVLNNDADPGGDTFSVNGIIDQPFNGSVVVNADGTITYTPNSGFTGNDVFEYRIIDSNGDTDTAIVNVSVNQPINSVQAVDDVVSVDRDRPTTIPVLSNDFDPEGDTITFDGIVTQPLNGTVTVNTGDGTITYTPDAGFLGNDVFQYRITDSRGAHSIADISIEVIPSNNTTNAVDDDVTLEGDTSITIAVLDNDSDDEGDTLAVDGITIQPSHGTVTLNNDWTITYTPNIGYVGNDVFQYEIVDQYGAVDTAIVNITVTQPPNRLYAENDELTIQGDLPATISILSNDSDPEGDTFSLDQITVPPANGSLTLNADGTVTYTPNIGYVGNDVFQYEIVDEHGLTAQADVNITVLQPPNRVYAEDDTVTVTAGQTTNIAVLNNDSDPEGDTFSLDQITLAAVNGTATVNADNTIDYTPLPGFTGNDVFQYQIIDEHGVTDIATVSIVVSPPPDSVNAADDTVSLEGNTSVNISVLSNDSDPEGDTFSIDQITVAPANGTTTVNIDGTITYTPNTAFVGNDTFQYQIIDANGNTDTASVSITVTQPTNTVDAVDDTYTMDGDASLVLDLLSNDTDPNGDTFSFDVITLQPANGALTNNADGTFTYSPNAGYVGTDIFQYRVTDQHGASDIATVRVTVQSPANRLSALNDQYEIVGDITAVLDILGNDTDPDGDTFSIDQITVPPANGSLTLNADDTVTYTPNIGFVGNDVFQYEIIDANGATDIASVAINVTRPENRVFANADEYEVFGDIPTVLPVLDNDTDPENDTFTVESIFLSPLNGTAAVNADGTITYTPNVGFVGADSFIYIIRDADGATDSGTVNVNVNTPPNRVTANDDGAVTERDQPVTIDLLQNDFDPEGDTFGFDSITVSPANGTLTDHGNGNVTYTPNAGFTGSDTFQYQISDVNGATNTANVTITVSEPTRVIAENDTVTTPAGDAITVDLLANDHMPTGQTVSINAITLNPVNGTLTDNGDGTVTYTPNAGFTGNDVFQYEAIDQNGNTSRAVVNITVS